MRPFDDPLATNGGGNLSDIGAFEVQQIQITRASSRKIHGSVGPLEIDLPLTGAPAVECRSSGGNHTLVFAFCSNVVSGSAALTTGSGGVAGSPTFAGNTMTVNLTGVADAQEITLTLSNVTDDSAQVLPNTVVTMRVLAGDTNGNSTVNASDIGATKAQSGAAVTAANARQDMNVNGSINASDIGLVKSRSGAFIPPASPSQVARRGAKSAESSPRKRAIQKNIRFGRGFRQAPYARPLP